VEAGASIDLRWQMSGQCGTILRFRVVEKDFLVECKGEIGRSSGIMRPRWSLEFNGGGQGIASASTGLCAVWSAECGLLCPRKLGEVRLFANMTASSFLLGLSCFDVLGDG
jgi:hypothetical protein